MTTAEVALEVNASRSSWAVGRGLRVALLLAGGGAVASGLYWGFLNTPESNVLTLATSALLLLMSGAVALLAISAALFAARGRALGGALRAAPRAMGWSLLVASGVLLMAWALMRFDRWVWGHQGEINAWFIVRFGMADIQGLLNAERWIGRWLAWVQLPLTGLALLAGLTGSSGVPAVSWLRRVWGWRSLLLSVAVFAALFVLPWQLTTWRPAVPPTWVEPVVAAVRLGLVVVAWVAGSTLLVLRAGTAADRTAP